MDIIPEQGNSSTVSPPPAPSSTKTWSVAMGIGVLFLLIAGTGLAYWYLAPTAPGSITDTSTVDIVTQEPTPSSCIFDGRTVKVGDTVCGLVVSDVNLNLQQSNFAIDFGSAEVTFKGFVEVKGVFMINPENPVAGATIEFTSAALPRVKEDERMGWFGIDQSLLSPTLKGGDKVIATLDEYDYMFYPSESGNSADLVSIKKDVSQK